ncbi:hypothetical protein H0H93_001174 [Arthromyces matolae]|nr:hypothetical protein H0H93_001174 [Arthromyces matolae]
MSSAPSKIALTDIDSTTASTSKPDLGGQASKVVTGSDKPFAYFPLWPHNIESYDSINDIEILRNILRDRDEPPESQQRLSPQFSYPRLLRLAGYEEPPVFLSSLQFDQLPYFSNYQGRLVEHSGQMYEFWSPNSMRLPYCPGRSVDSISIEIPTDKSQRRTDGHIGRFDPCVSPQMSSKPWLALVLLFRPPDKTVRDIPETSLINEVFEVASNRRRGTFQRTFLSALSTRAKALNHAIQSIRFAMQHDNKGWWADRPTAPSDADLARLEGEMEFETALDNYTYISRALKVKASWVEFMQRQVNESRWSVGSELMKKVQAADEWWMGTWANDLDEEMAFWFLRQRVPLFFAHDCSQSEISRCCEDAPRRSSFILDTDIFFDHILDAEACKTNMISPRGLTNSRILPKHLLPPPNGYAFSRKHSYFDLGRHSTLSESADFSSSPPQAPPPTSRTPASLAAPESTKRTSPYKQKPLDLVIIAPDRIAWIRPPTVRPVRNGKWEIWSFDCNDEGQGCFRKEEGCGRFTYYDRENLRAISVDERIVKPPGLTTDIEIFGLPAPDLPCEINVHQVWQERGRTNWLYKTRTPSTKDLNTEAPRPTANDLPVKEEGTADAAVPMFDSTMYDVDDDEEWDTDPFCHAAPPMEGPFIPPPSALISTPQTSASQAAPTIPAEMPAVSQPVNSESGFEMSNPVPPSSHHLVPQQQDFPVPSGPLIAAAQQSKSFAAPSEATFERGTAAQVNNASSASTQPSALGLPHAASPLPLSGLPKNSKNDSDSSAADGGEISNQDSRPTQANPPLHLASSMIAEYTPAHTTCDEDVQMDNADVSLGSIVVRSLLPISLRRLTVCLKIKALNGSTNESAETVHSRVAASSSINIQQVDSLRRHPLVEEAMEETISLGSDDEAPFNQAPLRLPLDPLLSADGHPPPPLIPSAATLIQKKAYRGTRAGRKHKKKTKDPQPRAESSNRMSLLQRLGLPN